MRYMIIVIKSGLSLIKTNLNIKIEYLVAIYKPLTKHQ